MVSLNEAEAKCLECKPVSVYFGCGDWCFISALCVHVCSVVCVV